MLFLPKSSLVCGHFYFALVDIVPSLLLSIPEVICNLLYCTYLLRGRRVASATDAGLRDATRGHGYGSAALFPRHDHTLVVTLVIFRFTALVSLFESSLAGVRMVAPEDQHKRRWVLAC